MFAVIGKGSAPASVITASLDDIGMKSFALPWYGKVPEGLETVYDWALDNNVPYILVRSDETRSAPKALIESAVDVVVTEDVDKELIKIAKGNDGHVLVLWDTEDEAGSVRIATMAIDKKLPTLELTNGLVPIVFDDSPVDEDVVTDSSEDFVVETVSDLPVEEDMRFTRDEMENMPAAAVKRHGANNGLDTKGMTKVEIINSLYGGDTPTGKRSIEDRLDTIERTLQTIVELLNK